MALVIGAVVGFAAARLHGPYLAGATLALAVAVPGIATYYGDTLGGEQGLRVRLPDEPAWVLDAAYFVTGTDLTSSRYIAYFAWITLIITFVLLANLSRSRVGRRWRAVRDDEVSAELAGINLGRARVSAFMVSAAAAGAAGGVLALAARISAPSGFTLTLSLSLLTAVVLGGLGSLTGALLGAALLTFLPQFVTDLGADAGLNDIQAAELAPLIYGLVMILVILLAPAGIVGNIRGFLVRNRTRPSSTGPTSEDAESSRGSWCATGPAPHRQAPHRRTPSPRVRSSAHLGRQREQVLVHPHGAEVEPRRRPSARARRSPRRPTRRARSGRRSPSRSPRRRRRTAAR